MAAGPKNLATGMDFSSSKPRTEDIVKSSNSVNSAALFSDIALIDASAKSPIILPLIDCNSELVGFELSFLDVERNQLNCVTLTKKNMRRNRT